MESRDIKFANEYRFNIRCEEPLVKDNTYDFQISSDGLVLSLEENKFAHVEIIETVKAEVINELKEFENRALLRVDKVTEGVYVLNLLEFYKQIRFDEPYQIVIDDAIFPELRRRKIEPKNAVKFFTNEVVYKNKYWFALGNDRKNSEQKLFGKKYSIVIQLSAQNYLHITEIRENRNHESRGNLITLMSGNIEFKDNTAEVSKMTQDFMNKYKAATRDNAELIDLWRIYDDLDQEAAKSEALAMGTIKYKSYKRNGGNLIFTVDGGYVSSDFLNSNMQYVAITQEQYDPEAPLDNIPRTAIPLGADYDKSCVNTPQLIIFDETLDVFGKLPDRGYILPSISGTQIQSKRRTIARKKILNGESSLIGLNLLLQSGDIVGVIGKERPAVTDHLRKFCFDRDKSKDFNDRQKDAIKIAINTPDIAVIQGPPGTGKTKVIKAIVERINELENGEARILISSTQHDAVDNAIDGVSYGGVPVNRVLTRKRTTTQDIPLYKWIDEMIDSCNKWLLENEPVNPLKEINQCIDGLKKVEPQFAMDELKHLYHLLQREGFSAEILAKTNEVIVSMIDYTEPSATLQSSSRLAELLSEQRTYANQFLEDGIERLNVLERYLKYECEEVDFDIPSYWKTLRRTSDSTPDLEEMLHDFAKDIELLRSQIMTDEKPIVIANESVQLKELIELVEGKMADRIDDVPPTQSLFDDIWEFKHELSNTENVKGLISKYSQVNAATCQQSANKFISPAMKGFDDKYDYVIIDEAARSNPLDLLIPMSMGKKIILVGDHKQLPHMVETDVVEAVIKKTRNESAKQVLEESLFMRLFNKVKEADDKARNEIEKPLTIPRTCTLNEQFRMHSAICDLINVFYQEEQLRPACEKGKEQEFDLRKSHNLNLYNNKPLAWIDVPITTKNPIEKGGISKSRPCEVEIVKRELNKILAANSEYDIGIITFYSKQEHLIQDMVDEEFASVPNNIQVGTVDAFQGKEFDVVILSTVRANTENESKRRVGFLNNNNRLCVAFSRAKSLLITIGDSKTVAMDKDVTYIEPLKELLMRSKREDVGYYEII